MKKEEFNYKLVFERFLHEEFEPTNFILLKIAYEIKTNNISTKEIYKIIDNFYRTRDYDTNGDYLKYMLEQFDK